MPVSQNSDNTKPTGRASATSLGGVPEAYARVHNSFTWDVPQHFNIAQVCCAR